MTYARDTSVSVDRSKAEIEKLLQRYGADQFMSGWDADRAFMAFRITGRQIKFVLPLPALTDEEFTFTPTGKARSAGQAFAAWEQACRSRWRALRLVIQAKLEAVEVGISTIEEEFLSWMVVTKDGQTAGEWLIPQIEEAYRTGLTPPGLPGLPGPSGRSA